MSWNYGDWLSVPLIRAILFWGSKYENDEWDILLPGDLFRIIQLKFIHFSPLSFYGTSLVTDVSRSTTLKRMVLLFCRFECVYP